MNHAVHQIYYSSQTRAMLDPGFIPLDNSGQRPDWYEYGPIRRFLLTHPLAPDTRYGFLSPKFAEKTGLTSAQVNAFLDSTPDDVDVVTFSPYFSNAAFFKNVFEQAEFWHPGIMHTIGDAIAMVAPGMNANTLTHGMLMSSMQTVYCNYFVAKPRFWRRWFELCEVIFRCAESGRGELAQRLNAPTQYVPPTPAKIFVIERIVSLLLSLEPSNWKVRNYNPIKLPADNNLLNGKFRDEMVTLDALKQAALSTTFHDYYVKYIDLRGQMIERLQQA
ncbi:hypothetical protein [Paraburkholderia sp. ZP32-5]|uniref:hypothetical protein n=1 Tax=Paraburkholderia sp. ZP32-5 TaxID=2883245 RepID=UPI001F1D29F2|nr:hypothetical protein [Paraburkholderia sp. ZP32-5]